MGAPVHAGGVDVAVLGGGVVGATCAWRLAQQGVRVALVDPAPGSGATGAAAGMLAPVSEFRSGEEDLLHLNLRAVRGFAAHAAELETATGATTGFRDCGTMVVAASADDRARLADVRGRQQRLGLDVQPLTGRECRRLEPFLDPAVTAGTLVPGDHQVDPRRLLTAVLTAARDLGVRTVATGGRIRRRGSAARGVDLDDGGFLDAAVVVLAAGAWSAPAVPVRPVKGQVLRLRMPSGEHVLQRTVRGRVDDRDVYLVPRRDGELVVGATSEERGLDRRVTAGAVRELLESACRLVPALEELELVQTLASHRPGSPDNLPAIGWTDVEGLIAATGHHRNGVLLSQVTAEAVTDLVCGRRPPPDVERCSPRRWAGVPGEFPAAVRA